MFSGLDRDALAEIAGAGRKAMFRKGNLLFQEGDAGDCLYVLLRGEVRVFVISEEGNAMGLVTLRPPETFGELAAIDGRPRSASAEALETTTVLVLDREVLLGMLAQRPELMRGILSSMSGVIRRLTGQTADLVFLDLPGRVAKLLMRLAEDGGLEPGAVLDLKMTQSELAAMVGASRQAVNQALHSFERRGYLEVRGRQIIVKRPDVLRRRAGL